MIYSCPQSLLGEHRAFFSKLPICNSAHANPCQLNATQELDHAVQCFLAQQFSAPSCFPTHYITQCSMSLRKFSGSYSLTKQCYTDSSVLIQQISASNAFNNSELIAIVD